MWHLFCFNTHYTKKDYFQKNVTNCDFLRNMLMKEEMTMHLKNIPVMPENPMLAQAYVPFQVWPKELYDLQKGLSEGTIFPELNQPYYKWEDCDE
jgi:hypothetical protein